MESTSASIHEAVDIHCDLSTEAADASNVVENKEDSLIENILEIRSKLSIFVFVNYCDMPS
ncbi:hypothetical protein TSAR_008075 [Trichomalopsis sarcophagae]|uniref:Uncharacterized protein n=1 Tax=Trichomalopsis sarcophagae TaxID=543379 RepID=A0A232FNF5_9HYME|nr:hypothetical protein TSAR_008075 [Trichomalopsis sarcophagae]